LFYKIFFVSNSCEKTRIQFIFRVSCAIIYINTGKPTKNDEITRYQKQELGASGSTIGRRAAFTSQMVVGSISDDITGIFH
jgi:hypothetical protein